MDNAKKIEKSLAAGRVTGDLKGRLLETAMNQLYKPKILIVDDDPNILELLAIILTKEGYKAFPAKSAEEALKLLKHHHFNLVISDLRMPGMDGLNLLREIKKLDAKLEVIIMTAYGDVETFLKAQTLGAYDFFPKPFDIGNLRQIIKQAVTYQSK